jgi:hypothetical protein
MRNKLKDTALVINEDYKVTSDSFNITLWRKNNAFRYFQEYSELLKFIVRYEVHMVGMADLEKVSKKQDEIYKLIDDTLKNKPTPQIKVNGGDVK